MRETAQAEVTPTRVPWKAVIAFVVISFALAWLVVLPLWLQDGLATPLAPVLLVVMMYTPAAAAIIVVLTVQRPRPSHVLEYLGIWPLRPAWRTVGFCLIGLFGTIALVVAGIAIAAALGLVTLDLTHFSAYRALIARAAPGAPMPPIGILVAVQLIVIPFGALVNAFATVGEEVGWRGWLLPSLRPLGTWPALALSGAIWGLWHAPIILLGYDFGLTDVSGVVLMVIASTLLGMLFGWLRLRTASVWPSVFAHGALNAAGGMIALFAMVGHPVDPVAAGPLGWAMWIALAVAIVVLLALGQFRRQPSLARRTRAGVPAPETAGRR